LAISDADYNHYLQIKNTVKQKTPAKRENKNPRFTSVIACLFNFVKATLQLQSIEIIY